MASDDYSGLPFAKEFFFPSQGLVFFFFFFIYVATIFFYFRGSIATKTKSSQIFLSLELQFDLVNDAFRLILPSSCIQFST